MLLRPFREELGILYGLNFCLLITLAATLLLLVPTLFWPTARGLVRYVPAFSILLNAVGLLLAGYRSDFRIFAIGKKKSGSVECLLLTAVLCYFAVKLLTMA